MINYYTCTFGHMRPDLWEGRGGVPVMIVASNYLSDAGRLRVRPVPPQCRPVFADCGGFYWAKKGVDYPYSYADYIAWLGAMRPDYAATWDYPCEAEVASDDAAVLSRQRRTIEHARALLSIEGSWEWVPVVQGRTLDQYLAHAAMYRDAGLVRPYMGIGSLCRRTRVAEIIGIVRAISAVLPGTRFHLFGVKSQIFRQREALPASVESADSGAWNGMFGKGRDKWKHAQTRGLSQSQYEVWEALPRYRTSVEAALGGVKQLALATT